MRIIAGSLKGRTFEPPYGNNTHPMGDRVKGALFNTLDDIKGLTVLDAYAGTGALSFEALSRGAASVVSIDHDGDAFKAIDAACKKLKLEDRMTVLCKNVRAWAKQHKDQLFDLVLADPPYDDIDPYALELVANLTVPGGVFVVSWPASEAPREFAGFAILKANTYAGAQLVFYRKQ